MPKENYSAEDMMKEGDVYSLYQLYHANLEMLEAHRTATKQFHTNLKAIYDHRKDPKEKNTALDILNNFEHFFNL
jgi:hypothetical protein